MAVQIGGDIPLGGRATGGIWTRARVTVQNALVGVLHDGPPGVRGFSSTVYTPDEAEAVGLRLVEAAEKARAGPATGLRWSGYYLPMDCPGCGRHRLEYAANEGGGVVAVRCEKCGREWPGPDGVLP